jgi:hypothetical protein
MDAAGVEVSWAGCCALAGEFGPCVGREIASEEVCLAFYTIVALSLVPNVQWFDRSASDNKRDENKASCV